MLLSPSPHGLHVSMMLHPMSSVNNLFSTKRDSNCSPWDPLHDPCDISITSVQTTEQHKPLTAGPMTSVSLLTNLNFAKSLE